MLADIVGSTLKGGANNHHKFFRYRDDVVGRRLGIVRIRMSAFAVATNDTKSIAGDIVEIPRGRMVAALPQEQPS
jgi:hypothetical protein